MTGRRVLSLTAASKSFRTRKGLFGKVEPYHVFGPLGFELNEGECAAVVGRSGAGKSTLARCLAGLERLTEGTLFFGPDGEDVTRRGPGPSVQLVFQDSPSAMNPSWNVARILAEPLLLARLSGSPEHLGRLLDQVGLTNDLLTRRPDQLSGGQRRRVSIARALAAPSLRVLILDEPFAGLDGLSSQGIAGLLSRLRKDTGMSLVLITHDLASVRLLASRLIVMARGSIVEELQGTDPLRCARHEETRALIGAVLPGALA